MNTILMRLQNIYMNAGGAVLLLVMGLGFTHPSYAADTLYVGDQSNFTVKQFNVNTGAFLGELQKNGRNPIVGIMGLIVNSQGNLLVSNLNAGTPNAGEIIEYDGSSGKLGALVPFDDPDAPFAPRGIVIGPELYVADLGDFNQHPGRIALYDDATGQFLGDLDTTGFHRMFNPRGLVFGPDGYLYVSVVGNLAAGKRNIGYILRFNPDTQTFVDIFASNTDTGCAKHLHRPEGLVFSPDGKLYVTAFQADADDTDKILVFDQTGACVDQIPLYQPGQPRAYAQALLFGPEGKLFVPISGGGPDAGAIRRYDVVSKTFVNFVPPAAQGGPLGAGWYLTFGQTAPDTLEYNP